ncbi:choice-of-anchor I family protein [Shimia sp. SDUM112013]|uniref:choice-of-anchor I family protein n=1 Tax=Shimia sp. SDUM112013 TaxID=3136160 RepID=UPI0032EEE5E4
MTSPFTPDATVGITPVGQLQSGETELFTGGSEVVSTDNGLAYVTNGAQDRIDVFDIATQTLVRSLDLSGINGYDGVQSVTATNGIVAAAIAIDDAESAQQVNMMVAEEGWHTAPILTIGGQLENGYTPVGIMDGIGAIAHPTDDSLVRIYVNHELTGNDGSEFEVDGMTLNGARVSYFDIDKNTLSIVDGGQAIQAIYNAAGERATSADDFAIDGGNGLTRLCSAQMVEAEQFGTGNGLVDTLFFTGEETGGNYSGVGGGQWVLDVDTGDLWAVPAFGRGAWENVTEIDTGTTTHVAFLLADDTSPFDADGDGEKEGAPIYLYVGEKDADSDNILAQNGLTGGQLYVAVLRDSGGETVTDPSMIEHADFGQITDLGNIEWVAVDNTPNMGMASQDGASDYDAFGYPTQRNLWTQAEQLNAFQASRPEDVATNPADGTMAVLASTGRQNDFGGADAAGDIYGFQFDFSNIDAPTATMNVLYDGDSDPAQTLRSPDNLEWGDDGAIYIQEDRANGDLYGNGAVNPNESGIVRLELDFNAGTSGATRIANIDQFAVPEGQIEENQANGGNDVGDWESSGILDVSSLFGRAPGTLFIYDVQAHGIDDQDRWVEGHVINDDELREGGQLGFLSTEALEVANPINNIAPSNGIVALFNENGDSLGTVEVGNLPDMLTFTPDGNSILVAGEGEPTDNGDPRGTVSIIDISNGVDNAQVTILDFTAFDGQEDALRARGVLIEPGNAASRDLEPEYIAVSPDGSTAWVTLQEANAVAIVDLTTNTVTDIMGLGLIDHSLAGNEIDASDRDGEINLANFGNLFGMRQPDAIASFEVDGAIYFVTANEGDARDDTESRIDDLDLDPTAFPDAETLQSDEVLGRLNVRTDFGDTDGDDDYDALYAYGGRSFTIYGADGSIVYESGALFSELVAQIRPELFNHSGGDFDGRSDNKGVEPEAVAVGQVGERTLLFVGLERDNGVVVMDVSNPAEPTYVTYIEGELQGNISPETIAFIPAEQSTSGQAQILVAYEGDGNTAIFDVETALESIGTDGDDRLVGTDLNDQLNGADGRDTLNGGDGDDLLVGGTSDADLFDLIFAGAGNDTATGGAGNDLIFGMDGNDQLSGGVGADTLAGQTGDDIVSGGAGSDILHGNAGADFLNGGFGNDQMHGGDGADRFFHAGQAGHGSDWIADFAEVDRLIFGGTASGADDFVVQSASVTGAGDAGTEEAFVTHVATGQILFALVDGADLTQLDLTIAATGETFDLLA